MNRPRPRLLISLKTRTLFEDHLTNWSTLREIEVAFEESGIPPDRTHRPSGKGERRTLIRQYYHSLDLSTPQDTERLLQTIAHVIGLTEARMPDGPSRATIEDALARLKASIAKDGFVLTHGRFERAPSAARSDQSIPNELRTITEVTRRAIFDKLVLDKVQWSGKLAETEFLERVFGDLSKQPSHDRRFRTMSDDIHKHRVINHDWDDDWAYYDGRLDLLRCDDATFLKFVCDMAHPLVRPAEEARTLVEGFNEHLAADGWTIAAGKRLSGRPTYCARRLTSSAVALPEPLHVHEVLSDEYVNELSAKCDSRLASGDLDGAVTVGRTLLEAVLGELELRLAGQRGDYKGDMPRQFKAVTKLLRMDESRSDLDDRFKDVIRGLVMIANGLAPLRNKLSDGHARVRKPAMHHARVVVNAAKTVASFLVESYLFQKAKGLIQASEPQEAP